MTKASVACGFIVHRALSLRWRTGPACALLRYAIALAGHGLLAISFPAVKRISKRQDGHGMSDTDSFIEEVTEEVRRDRLYKYLRQYGWIGVVFVLVVVGGTAWQAWQSDAKRSAAQALGDNIVASLDNPAVSERALALDTMVVEGPRADAVRRFLQAAAELDADDVEAARLTLLSVEMNTNLPIIYRQVASFKSLAISKDILEADERRRGLEDLAIAGNPLRLLAEEQLALIDVETKDIDAAITRFQSILNDAETTPDLQQRAVQVIVSLGGEPDLATDDNESE